MASAKFRRDTAGVFSSGKQIMRFAVKDGPPVVVVPFSIHEYHEQVINYWCKDD
jgi:hypothetical protein